MEKERKMESPGDTNVKKPYVKPAVTKHENLKEITLLSFTPPTS